MSALPNGIPRRAPVFRAAQAGGRGHTGTIMFALLAILFLVVPIAELAVILLIGQQIGVWWTIALLIADSVFGAWLARREGNGAWRRFRAALDSGRVPTREIADGALILFAAALMLTPGFLTDLLGILLLLPPTRAVARRALLRWLARRAARRVAVRFRGGRPGYIDGQSEVQPPGRSTTSTTWGRPEPSRPPVEPDQRR
jgi:UPF0716 protein FxsA